jgi:putative peptidoglycan lipid II flippase
VIAAGAVQLAIQIPVLRRVGMSPRPSFAFGHPAVRRLLVLMGPSVLGASVYQFNLFIVRALASFQGEGAISYLYYADRLLEFPLGVFVFAIGSASLTALSRCVKAGDAEGLRRSFSSTLALAAALAVPSTAGLVLLREGLCGVLFNWNTATFGDEAVRGCARALLFYALGLVPITAARIYAQLLIAHENTRTPAWAAVVSVVVNALSALMLIGPLPPGTLPDALLPLQHSIAVADLGYAGLALATTIAALANMLFLAGWTARHHPRLFGLSDVLRHGRIALATLVMGVALVALESWAPLPTAGSPRAVGLLLVHVALGGVLYLVVLRALRSPEFGALAALAQLRR